MSGVNYSLIDSKKLGLTTRGAVPPQATQWAGGTVYALGALVLNGGFLFRCSVAGTSAAEVAAPAQAGPAPNVLVDNTVTWVLVSAVSDVCQIDSTAQHDLGQTFEGRDLSNHNYGTAEFMYVKFTGTCNPGDGVIVDPTNFTCTQIPNAAPGASKYNTVALAMGSGTNGTFGWVMIRGTHDQANVTAALAVGTILTGSATAGRFNQGVVNYIIDGGVLKSAGVAGNGTVQIYWPSCSGR